MKKWSLFLAVVALGISAQSFGKGKEVEPDKGDGCGLGWQITKERTMLATTTRGTTNAFVPPTFGMTTGTIGCEQHSFAMRERAAAEFAYNNIDKLTVDMARGEGEYITSLARAFGCADSAVKAFGETARAALPQLLEKTDSGIEFYQSIKASVRANPALLNACPNAA